MKIVNILIVSLLMVIVGCVEQRELLETKSNNSKPTDNGYVYENDTVRITYFFWAERGQMGMRIHNKLSIPIFIDWKISNYIINDNNFQYWYDVQNSQSVSTGVNYYGLQTLTGTPASVNKRTTNTSTEHPDRITSITPHSEITKAVFTLLPDRVYVDTGHFTQENSPLKFRSFLAFSMDEAQTQKFYIDNRFYVSNARLVKEGKFEKPTNHVDVYIPNPIYKNWTSFYSQIITEYHSK